MKGSFETYINNVTAEYFGPDKLKESQQHTEEGWYWADKDDNARYSDWIGVYPTRKTAIDAAKQFRIDALNEMILMGLITN